jgi:spore germination protein YaaH
MQLWFSAVFILLSFLFSWAGAPVSAALAPASPQSQLVLAWDHVKSSAETSETAPVREGLQVLSPTWFSLADATGSIYSKGSAGYVTSAHQKGCQVWALLDNGFDANRTRQFLASAPAQDKAIQQLSSYAAQYQLDGINIDFENVADEDRDRFTLFIRNLTAALKKQKLIISIDVTVPNATPSWSHCYDRKELAAIVDYVMVMTYDEQWATSTPGAPVASLPWVEKNLQKTLQEVPANKLFLGIPFYTKRWEHIEEQSKTTYKGKTFFMDDVTTVIQTHNVSPQWRSEYGLSYLEYEEDGKYYHIWVESKDSMALKTALVRTYQLAGAACWRLGFETPDIWPLLP